MWRCERVTKTKQKRGSGEVSILEIRVSLGEFPLYDLFPWEHLQIDANQVAKTQDLTLPTESLFGGPMIS